MEKGAVDRALCVVRVCKVPSYSYPRRHYPKREDNGDKRVKGWRDQPSTKINIKWLTENSFVCFYLNQFIKSSFLTIDESIL